MPVIIYFVEESEKNREFCISLSEQFGQLEEFRWVTAFDENIEIVGPFFFQGFLYLFNIVELSEVTGDVRKGFANKPHVDEMGVF